VLETNIQLLNIDINMDYKYLPSLNSKMLETNIVLFKALKADINFTLANHNNLKRNMYKIFKYYAKKTHSNHLEDLLESKKFTVVAMPCNHSSCMDNNSQLTKICNEIRKHV